MLIQKIYQKGSGKLNEDELLIKGNLFAVIDGASSLVDFVNDQGETGGKIASRISKEEFSKNNKSLEELALRANNKIRKEMQKLNIDLSKKENLFSATVAMIRLNNNLLEFFTIGDCFILSLYKNNLYNLLVPYIDHDLETMKLWKILADKKIKNIRSLLGNQIKNIRKQANVNYGSLNGEQQAIDFFNYGKIPLSEMQSLIIFTDGLLIPKEAPEEEKNGIFLLIYINHLG